jgi:large subunit ribosomal protein L5
MAGLAERYRQEVVAGMRARFPYTNVMQVPRLQKVVVNMGVGDAVQNSKLLDSAVGELAAITGQKPVVTRARKSVASFKLREGMGIGAMVTLRGQRMYDFMERLIFIALPRVRDFRGLSPDSFDGRGNYTLGLREQLIFPEVDYDQVEKIRGMDVTIVTTAQTDEEARELLRLLGMPFRAAAS